MKSRYDLNRALGKMAAIKHVFHMPRRADVLQLIIDNAPITIEDLLELFADKFGAELSPSTAYNDITKFRTYGLVCKNDDWPALYLPTEFCYELALLGYEDNGGYWWEQDEPSKKRKKANGKDKKNKQKKRKKIHRKNDETGRIFFIRRE